MMDLAERARRCQEYIDALEDEHRKIQVFQRDLPLSLHLVSQTIECCRRQMERELFMGPSECEMEDTSIHGPVLEEFMPLKPNSSSSEEHYVDDKKLSHDGGEKQRQLDGLEKKPDWLRSVQLWNQDSNSPPSKKDLPLKPIAVEAKKGGGAFHPFHKEKPVPVPVPEKLVPMPAKLVPVPAATSSSSADTGGGSGGATGTSEGKDGQSHRKSRRCWSPELHRRFLQALQQLGGSHVATPKQIRDLMKVDGLTNDEVKSHLQKYRLHTRRPTPAVQANNSSPQAPQFVLVGGLWAPPPEYAAAATAAAAAASKPTTEGNGALPNGIYAPIASLPSQTHSKQQQQKQLQGSPKGPLHSGERVSREEHSLADDEATTSVSPATSSSSHTTTISPSY